MATSRGQRRIRGHRGITSLRHAALARSLLSHAASSLAGGSGLNCRFGGVAGGLVLVLVGFIHQGTATYDGAFELNAVFREWLLVALITGHRRVEESTIRVWGPRGGRLLDRPERSRDGFRTTILKLCRSAGFTPLVRQDAWLQQTTPRLIGVWGLEPRGAGQVLCCPVPLRRHRDGGHAAAPRASQLVEVTRDWASGRPQG